MIAILSGKGGAGKTTLAVLLAYVRDKPLVGADVESPTTMIAYGDEPKRSRPVYRRVARVTDACVSCGICATACPFGAIMMLEKAVVDPEACEGCMYCASKCPVGAISEERIEIGEIRYGERVLEGAIKPGEKESRVVLEELLDESPGDAIVDGPPGASPLAYRVARRSEAVIVVVEPTKPGVADARRVLMMLAGLRKPSAIVTNKSTVGDRSLAEALAKEFGVPIIGEIRFHPGLLKLRPLEVPEAIEDASRIERAFAVPEYRAEELRGLPEPPRAELKPYIAVVSGKGGTGKTLVSIGLARYLGIPVVDADVDAPDSRVLMGEPERKRSISGRVYEVDPEACDGCGLCAEACYNRSIEVDSVARISPELCEGCGLCAEACPKDAIRPREIALGFIGEGEGYMLGSSVVGRAGIGEFVHDLKLAASKEFEAFVLDGSPGSGCSTIAAISGSKAAIIVVEPKPESVSSARRVAEIADHFGVRKFVVLNKRLGEPIDLSGLGEFLGYIPFDESVFDAYARGERPEGSKAAEAIRKISQRLLESLGDLFV